MSVLAIDQGTTNTKALLIDESGGIVASGTSPLKVAYPRPGWVEASGHDIWHSVLVAVASCLRQSPGRTIAAIGISNQRESVLVWDRRTGEPIGPCVIWQCRPRRRAARRGQGKAGDGGDRAGARSPLSGLEDRLAPR
jgi:glycerol kinase